MVDQYWRRIEDIENDVENTMQISSILLKLKEYDDDLKKIDTNENNISSNLGKIDNNINAIKLINKISQDNSKDISDNFRKIGINTVDISNNLNEINNITKTIMLKNIYFTDFDSIERSFTNELLYFDHKDTRKLSATIKHLNMEYSFKKDDFIEIEYKLMISHNSYEDSKK